MFGKKTTPRREKTRLEWCTEFEANRVVARSGDIAKLIAWYVEADFFNIPQKYREDKANWIQDKYSCAEPENIFLQRKNYLDPVGNAQADIWSWAQPKIVQGAKDIWSGVKATPSGLKHPGKVLKNQLRKDFNAFPYDLPDRRFQIYPTSQTTPIAPTKITLPCECFHSTRSFAGPLMAAHLLTTPLMSGRYNNLWIDPTKGMVNTSVYGSIYNGPPSSNAPVSGAYYPSSGKPLFW